MITDQWISYLLNSLTKIFLNSLSDLLVVVVPSLGQGRDAAVTPVIPVEAVKTLDPDGWIVTKIWPDTATCFAGGGRGSQSGRGGDCARWDGAEFIIPESGILN